MAGLRAKPPEVQPNRFRALIYGAPGAGKTHFCATFPNTYYIDAEGITKYKHFVQMLQGNKSDVANIFDLPGIISEVKELLTAKHDYKTLVIDSISQPGAELSNLEAERLQKKAPHTEGTEFGANVAKTKRLIAHLGALLTRIDMNVMILAHEKAKYVQDKQEGYTYDVTEKMSHALGTTIRLEAFAGKKRRGWADKSRYSEIPEREFIDLTDGYEEIKKRFGAEVFERQSVAEVLATPEQVEILNRLIKRLNVSDEIVQKWKIAARSNSLEEMNTDKIQACINKLQSSLTQGEENEI